MMTGIENKTTEESKNALFDKHYSLIKTTIWRNRPLLAALRLEDDDVTQDLSICLLSAIGKLDAERPESAAAYLSQKLQYEILNMKRRYKPHGVTGVPESTKISFLYVDETLPGGSIFEIPSSDDTSDFEISELLNSLSVPEAETLELKLKGFSMRRKAQQETLAGVRGKYTALYENERGMAA